MIIRSLGAVLAFAVAIPFLVTEGKADSLGVDFSSTPGVDSSSSIWNLGYQFAVVNTLTVTALADFDAGSLDSLPQDQQVGLWDDLGNLLGSAFIGSDQGSTQVGYWGVTSITAVILTAGNTYVVGAQGGMGYNFTTPLTVNPNITLLQNMYISIGSTSNSPLGEPTSNEAGPTAAFLGGNFVDSADSTLPEPATFLLFAPALAGLCALRRRKRIF
jgi:hypothetical protein